MMPRNVQVKNVPDDVHRVLRQRAAAAGQSQEYLLGELTEIRAASDGGGGPRSGAGQRRGGQLSLKTAAADVRAERDARSGVVDASVLARRSPTTRRMATERATG